MTINPTHQRINQVLSQAGLSAVIGDAWDEIDTMTDKMGEVDCVRLSPLDLNPLAQQLAQTLIEFQQQLRGTTKDVLIIENWCSGYDESQPATMNRPYALAHEIDGRIPLDSVDGWRHVADHLASYPSECLIQLSPFCNGKRSASEVWPVKVGEIICVFKTCTGCLDYVKQSPTADPDCWWRRDTPISEPPESDGPWD